MESAMMAECYVAIDSKDGCEKSWVEGTREES
jgi:hypothetical protein